jgi:hypothetical protein
VRRVLLALAVAAGLLVLAPSPSWACSCAPARTPEHVKRAVTIASGTIDWTATDRQTRTYAVDVDAVYKGAAAASEKLRTDADAASCGLANLATDRRYLFFIDGRHPGTMQVNLCGGTVEYDDATAQRVEAITGPPRRPLPVSTPDAADTEDNSTRDLVLGLGALVLLLALGGAVAVQRRGWARRG